MATTVYVVANGDLRLSANPDAGRRSCAWKTLSSQPSVVKAVKWSGRMPSTAVKKHGFIDSQKRGMEYFVTCRRTRLWW